MVPPSSPPPPADRLRLRQRLLAATVLADIDVIPGDDGVHVAPPDEPAVSVHLPWAALAEADQRCPPEHEGSVWRLARVLRAAPALARYSSEQFIDHARLVAVPPGHVGHAGPGWARARVLGGALDLGLGVLGVLDDRLEVVALTTGVIRAVGHTDTEAAWTRARDHADRMGSLAAARLRRDGTRTAGVVLRPVGGCDVLALLATRSLRGYLAAGDGSGMRAVAVPMRSRGWFDLARIDPPFVAAAWTATAAPQRGLPRPALVTADEVCLAATGGDPVSAALS